MRGLGVLMVAFVLLLGLSACEDTQKVDDLTAQVSALQGQVSDLEAQVSTAQAALHSYKKSTQKCLHALLGVATQIAPVSHDFAQENALFGLPVYYDGQRCAGTLSSGTRKHLANAVHQVNAEMNQLQKQRLQATLAAVVTTPSSQVTAICADGSTSYSQHAQGTCSSHSGVDHWVNYPA